MSAALLHAWERTLRRRGDAPALVQAVDGLTFTFRELDALATAWLARTTQTIPPTSLARRAVVFAEPNGARWFEIFLGLLRAGAVVVPLDAGEPPAAQRTLATALRAAFLWDGTRLVPLPRAKRHRDPAICLLKLTSGTTGRPRALAFTGAQLLADAHQILATVRITARDVNYGLIPLGHSYGLGNLTLPLLVHGISLVCGSAALPQAIATDFARWRPTVFPGVPALWRALAASSVALDSLRLGISAGSPLPLEVARDFTARFGLRLHGFYGSSETGGIAYDPTGHFSLNGSVGPALHGVKLTALSGQRLAVTSPAVFTQGNRRHSRLLGTWVMADRIARDSRGTLTVLGRRGTSVKIAGRRVNLLEVTARLRLLPGVTEAWVGVSETGEPVLGTVVVSSRSVAELRAALHADTPAWKIPKKWATVTALPTTARGKTDTRALRQLIF